MAILFHALDKKDYTKALRTLKRSRVGRKEVVAHRDAKGWKRPSALTVVLSGLPEQKRPWPAEWEELVREVLTLVRPADLLKRRNRIAKAASVLDEEVVTLMVEKCMGAPEFTVEARLKVLAAVVRQPWPALATLLAQSLEAWRFCGRRYVREAITCRQTAVFKVLAAALSNEQLLACHGKDTLLHEAWASHLWEVAELLLDRTPEALAVPGKRGEGVIHRAYRAPPLELWRRAVEGTPEELLLLRSKQNKQTILHKAVRLFTADHVGVLAVSFPLSARNLRNSSGETALQLAQRKADGKLRSRIIRDIEAEVEDALAMIHILGVGTATKAAGVC